MNDRDTKRTLTITRGGVIGSILVLIVAATCVRLGIWQIDRLRQRQARNAQVEARLEGEPLTVTGALADTMGLSYRPARATGGFDHDRSIVLPGRSFRGLPGVYVLTPLRLNDSDAAVLVNRGWVPAADAATIDLERVRVGVDTSITGLVLPFPGARSSLAPAATLEGDSAFRRVWFAVDEAALRAQFPYRLLDVQLQLLPDSARGYPRALPPPSLDEGSHRGYAFQWFGFATIAIVGWIALLGREHRNRVRPPDD
jgi:surfeit locus 1 family protein